MDGLVIEERPMSRTLSFDPDMPKPTGYRMVVSIPDVEEQTSGGLYKPVSEMQVEKDAATVGLVVAMGPDCYADMTRFPNGAYCTVGDWVMFKRYSGTRFSVNGSEYRVFNDDSVQAVVPNPSALGGV